jgi:hypothetical protein
VRTARLTSKPLGLAVGIHGIGERKRKGDLVMLWTIVGILFVLWLLGFSMHVGGALIHALLVIAIIVVVVNMLRGRSSV